MIDVTKLTETEFRVVLDQRLADRFVNAERMIEATLNACFDTFTDDDFDDGVPY